MKKIFTLIATALMAVGANAQESWVAPAEAPAAGTAIIKGDLMKVSTEFETTCGTLQDEDGNATPAEFAGKTFNTYMQIRVDAAPTAAVPTGTDKGGSTPLIIEAKENVDITVYYRRQSVSVNDGEAFTFDDNDGKDMKLIDQSEPATAIPATSFTYYEVGSDHAYANTIKTYKLDKGKTYTLWARGTTIRLYGIDYQAGSGSVPVEPSNTYFISYNVEPALSNVTLEGMANTGTSNNVATWEDGFSIMIMRSDKGMSSGSDITVNGTKYKSIKVSNGAQNTLTLPEGKVAKGITFYSYVNKDAATERDSYWKEVAGVTYDTPDASGGIFASYKDLNNPDKRTYDFGESQLNSISFTNTGEQCCYVIEVTIATGEPTPTGIKNVKSEAINLNAPMYNLAGQKVAEGYKGVVIQNGVKRIQK